MCVELTGQFVRADKNWQMRKKKNMRNRLRRFARSEEGAVSVDWVVMCASIVCFGCLAVATASDGTFGLADSISDAVSTQEVVDTTKVAR